MDFQYNYVFNFFIIILALQYWHKAVLPVGILWARVSLANVILLQIKHQCQLTQHHIPEIRAKCGISCVQTCVIVLPKLSIALIDLFML